MVLLLKRYRFLKRCYLPALAVYRSNVIIHTFIANSTSLLQPLSFRNFLEPEKGLPGEVVKSQKGILQATFNKAMLEIRNLAMLWLKEILKK